MNVAPVPVEVSHSGDSNPQRPLSISTSQQEASDDSAGVNFDSNVSSFNNGNGSIPGREEVSNLVGGSLCEEQNPDSDRSEMVVAPLLIQPPKPHRPPDIMWQINHDVSKNYSNLMKGFSNLMEKTHQELTERSVLVEKFTVYLMGIKSNMKFGFTSKEVKLNDIKNWTGLFDALSEMKAWDCLNYELLRDLFEKYLLESELLKEQLESYDREVQRFLDNTLLLDFLDIYKELFPDESDLRRGCVMLKAKTRGNLSTTTLSAYHSIRGYLMCQFRLQHYVLRLATANEGCLLLFWYIPQRLASHIQKICQEVQPDLGQAGVAELCIDNKVLYQARNVQEMKRDERIEPVSDVMSEYNRLLAESIKAPKEFWSRMAAKTLLWKEGNDCVIEKGKLHWFDGKLNASVNCLDRHAKVTPNKVAIIWEKNDGSHEKITYRKLLEMTCQIANVLKQKGVQKSDIVLIYMTSSPIAVASMFACTRIGAVHSVTYAVLKVNELEARIRDSKVRCVITSAVAKIGDKEYPLKKNVDRAWSSISLRSKPSLESRCCSVRSLDAFSQHEKLGVPPLELQRSLSSGTSASLEEEEQTSVNEKKSKPQFVVLVSNSEANSEGHWNPEQDFRLEEEMARCSTVFEPEYVEAEHTMFIMYTSGTSSTKVPTGIKHCTAGYLLYVALSHQYVFDHKIGDVFGCMADLGWITGHSYVIYGPLCNGATTVLFEGTATYPSDDRYWKAISDHKINQFYVTPYVISQLMKLPNVSKCKKHYDLSSLKTIATVGEPLSSQVLGWFRKNFGHEGCKFVDTWWQTEMGGVALIIDHELKDLPKGNFPAKPFFGVNPVIIDPKLKGEVKVDDMVDPGFLCIKETLPGMGRGVTEICTKAFSEMYFKYPGYGFFTQDLALKLKNGGYRVTGRLNNAMRIQGMWLDVASIEDQMNGSDERIVKTTLVGIPDKHVNTDKYEYEGACVFMECSSNDKGVQDEIREKVLHTVKERKLLPDKTTNEIFPSILVLFVTKWILTPSGKTIIPLYQKMIDLVSQIWSCTSSEIPFTSFCKQYLEVQLNVNF